MEYRKLTIKTRSDAEEIMTGILAKLGIYSLEIEDSVPLTEDEKARMFVDIAPEREDDGNAFISFYLEGDADLPGVLSELQREIAEYKKDSLSPSYIDIGDCSITSSLTEDEDWINNWKKFFSGFYIGDILFLPSWESGGKSDEQIREELSAKGDKEPSFIVRIDPGLAFGTGKHETTRLCIEELERNVKVGDRILDIGTGSGILSLMAFKFGAGEVFATDLDEAAVISCRDNFERNSLSDAPFTLVIGNIIDDKAVQDKAGYGCYDIVVANILADILIPMTGAAVAALKKGGMFITSGIIDGREMDVAAAMKEAGLSGITVRSLGEWRLVTGVKP